MAVRRFRNPVLLGLDVVLAALVAVAAVGTWIWPEWVEEFFGVDPDRGNGQLEWLIVVAFATASLLFTVFARREWGLPVRSATNSVD